MLNVHLDGLVQERRNSIANALELRLPWTNPSYNTMRHMKYARFCRALICFVLAVLCVITRFVWFICIIPGSFTMAGKGAIH